MKIFLINYNLVFLILKYEILYNICLRSQKYFFQQEFFNNIFRRIYYLPETLFKIVRKNVNKTFFDAKNILFSEKYIY